MPVDKDALGERGESIFRSVITKLHGDKPLFRPAFLGEKWPVADFGIELWGHPGKLFLVQVRATSTAVNHKKRLPIGVAIARANALYGAPLPSFVVGVHEPSEQPYIVTVDIKRTQRISSIPTKFSLQNATVRQTLHDEVLAFWNGLGVVKTPRASAFSDV
ncbi:hypothetical protein SOCEGT47_019710 [Sorangium cellulosum]|uniref:DUF4365 domain-containing protein n=1 Tax=Sorangium cellulosum TaxID=56 RepID=A0A4P2PXD7_SORCE|nr:hypothetical protein [Sorangium cellulosum]AUX21487.1 hypothetical protein SOCEGT47_019710 [Sorangium cellulosum]